jgi:DNA-damage-inducible protein J
MTIRIDKDLKKNVDTLFKNLGTNTNSAINMFLRQCDREQGLVFTPTMAPAPSKELLASLQEIDDYKNGKVELESYKDVKDLRKALIDD